MVTSATLIRFVAGTFGQRDEVIATDEELGSLIGRVREALGDAEIADSAPDEERDRAVLRKLGSAPINGIVVNDLTNGRTYLPPQAVARITAVYVGPRMTVSVHPVGAQA